MPPEDESAAAADEFSKPKGTVGPSSTAVARIAAALMRNDVSLLFAPEGCHLI